MSAYPRRVACGGHGVHENDDPVETPALHEPVAES